ncbi:O-antigen ligase family protein [Patescibacteria group bacterium]|nr:O-antigen ligase family protein [Patescibacteria group bacterium]
MFKKNNLNNLILNSLIGIIIFLLPTNFFLKFFENGAYVNGLQVDYLIPKLYLSDIFILSLFLIWSVEWWSKNKSKRNELWKKIYSYKKKFLQKKSWVLILFIIFTLRQFWANYPISSLAYLFRVIELGLFVKFLVKNKSRIYSELVEKSVIATLFFQSSVAIYQYVNQKTLIGYSLLGEPNLNNYIGISKSELYGIEKILPYGTTAHPNLLGGFLAIYLLYLFNKTGWKSISEFKSTVFIQTQSLVICLSIVTLFLTQSVSAIETFILGLCFIFYQKYSKKTEASLQKIFNLKNVSLIALGFIFLSIISINLLSKGYSKNQSLNRRNYLNVAALKMAKNNILVGVGLNNFTSIVEEYSNNREVVRFVQPAHNIFLLFFAETGILGLAVLGSSNKIFFKNRASIFYRLRILQKKPNNWWWILVLLPIALLDHYFLTLNAGMLLLVFSAVFLSEAD